MSASDSTDGFGAELAELLGALGLEEALGLEGAGAGPLPAGVVLSRGLVTWAAGARKVWPVGMKPSVLAARVGVFPGTVAAAPFLELAGLEGGNVRVRARKFHQGVYQDVVCAEFLPDCRAVAPGTPARLDPLVARPELGSRTVVRVDPHPLLVLATVNFLRDEIATSLRYLAGGDSALSAAPGDYSDYILKPLFDPENVD